MRLCFEFSHYEKRTPERRVRSTHCATLRRVPGLLRRVYEVKPCRRSA